VPLAQVPEFLVWLWEHDISLASTYASVTSHKHFPDRRPNRHNRHPAGQKDIKQAKASTWALHHAVFNTRSVRREPLSAPIPTSDTPTSVILVLLFQIRTTGGYDKEGIDDSSVG